MESWRRFAPEFSIVEWNESNFDVSAMPFTRDALADRSFAFVSDVARAKILYEHGGVYLDTDMELLRPLVEFLQPGVDFFSGYEPGNFVVSGMIGSVPRHPIWEKYMVHYSHAAYWNADGSKFSASNVPLFTALLEERGLVREDRLQCFGEIVIYPSTVFCPLDYRTGKLTIAPESAAIHHYAGSWLPWHVRVRPKLKKMLRKYICK
jgi:hypothetical protein